MKTRTGFVANSSSSSYIIAVDESIASTPCPTCNRVNISIIDLLDGMNGYYSDSSGVDQRGYEQIKDYLVPDLTWQDEEEAKATRDLIKKVKKMEDRGFDVYRIRINYHDDYLKTLLHHSDGIEIIENHDE